MDLPNGREETLFDTARQLTSPCERRAFLDSACAGNRALLQRLDDMLARQEEADRFFLEGQTALSPARLAGTGTLEAPGCVIGRYKLLEKIGEGGYGVVYMAEQQEPVRRRVALKVIKLGMDTHSVVARFEAERQALALMDHPNIARVLDAGATETGRPFVVMELVHGARITEYCDRLQIPTRGRLELFFQVCQAVQHAHQKGVIHRDLKPSNILVAENDGKAVPKVIDFGIAKAIDRPLTEKTLFTAFAQFLGTPAYMSPEQAGMTSADIDTRADIYSLGVLLYELLTGQTPFDTQQLLKSGWDAMRRTICEQEPPRPSSSLGTMTAEKLTGLAQRRQTEPARLVQQVRGDLDWIMMMCLEKDRARRYQTANGLAMDVQRHLRNEPILARPPSALYELQKTIRRHKVGFIATAAIITVLVGGVLVSTSQAIRANRALLAARLAEAKTSELEKQARLEAMNARTAEADAREKLRDSYLAQAQAGRWSRRAGRRFNGLELLKEAAKIHPGLDLRNEAIACMALADIRSVGECPVPSEFGTSFDPGYDRYVYGDAQGTVHILRVQDSKELMQFPGYEPPFRNYEFSPDGNMLLIAYGRNGERVEILHLDRKAVLLRLTQPGFRCVGFSADSRFAAIAFESSELNWPIRIFDLKTAKEIASLEHGSLPYYLRFQPDNPHRFLTSDASAVVRLWDWSTGKLVRSFDYPGRVQGISWHPEGKFFAAGCADHRVYLSDLETGVKQLTLIGHEWFPVEVSFSPHGEFLVSRGWEGIVYLWDPYSGHELLRKPVYGFSTCFGTSANRFGAATGERTYGIFEVAGGYGYRLLRGNLVTDGRGISCDFSADGRFLISSHENGIRLWDLRSAKCVDTVFTAGSWPYVKCHPDGTNLFVGTGRGVEEWSIESADVGRPKLTRYRELEASSGVSPIQMSADGRTISHMTPQGMQLIDKAGGLETSRLLPLAGTLRGTLSPDSQKAATYTVYEQTNKVDIWNVAESRIIKTLTGAPSVFAAFSSNNRWFTMGDSVQFRTWNVENWELAYSFPRELSGHYAYLDFSPDGHLLAVAISRYTVRLVDAASGHQLATLEGPDSMDIECIRFNRDGTCLAVVNGAGTIQLWDLRAIREQLSSMKLDWDAPDYPPFPHIAK